MNIAIDIRSTLKNTRTGIGQYTYNLVKNLSFIDNKNQYSLYAKKRLFSLGKKLPNISASNFIFRIDRFNRGLDRTLGKVDIFHTPSMDLLDITDAKIIVTVHDLIFKTYPQGHSKDALKNTERHLLHVLDKADRIICYSQNTVNDLKRFYNVEDKKIKLIYVGIDKKLFYVMDDKELKKAKTNLRRFGIDGRFILFVGTIEPRKNIDNLIFAFNNLKKKNNIAHKLVIIGMRGWLYEKTFELYNRSIFKNDIVFLGYQPNSSLKNFYNLADVFVYPSYYEGFGFPILEAFSCGTAVVTSNISSCKEIGQDAALLINPNDIDELSEAIFNIINDTKLKRDLKIKGLEKAKQFCWNDTAKKTLEVYKEVLNQ
jgi:glycosyltransferase involved in cell wall biosynthesis